MKIKKLSFVTMAFKVSVPEEVKREMENYKKFAKEMHGTDLTDGDIFVGAVQELFKTDKEFKKWKKDKGVK